MCENVKIRPFYIILGTFTPKIAPKQCIFVIFTFKIARPKFFSILVIWPKKFKAEYLKHFFKTSTSQIFDFWPNFREKNFQSRYVKLKKYHFSKHPRILREMVQKVPTGAALIRA